MSRIRLLMVCSALTLSSLAVGCSEPKTEDAAAPPAAALPPGRPAIYTIQAEGPEPFVRALYAVYVAGGPRDEPPAPGQDPIYSRIMNAVIGADVRIANGEVPTLNYDLLCGCQDQGTFTLDSLTITQAGPAAASADVTFTNAGQTTRQTLKLVREGINWKVDDIVETDGRSVKDETLKVIEAAGG